MQSDTVQRLRLIFSKDGPARYISHLDLVRTFERSLIRASIPVAYTKGYNPQPKLQFAAPLPLGFTSSCEVLELWLVNRIDQNEAFVSLSEKVPFGLGLSDLSEVDLSLPALQTMTRKAEYLVWPSVDLKYADLVPRFERLLGADAAIRIRRGKEYDLRPLIYEVEADPTSQNNPTLRMVLALGSNGSGRPDEVLKAMDLDPLSARIHRTAIHLAQADT